MNSVRKIRQISGVVGILKNGDGPTVMLRADMDAMPMKEDTGVPYASTKEGANAKGETVPVAHSCGHDMHTSWLLGAATVLSLARETWHGTLMTVFQPAEETAQGSQAMLDDGLMERFPRPDVILGQHLLPFRAGTVGYHSGQILTSGDSLLVRFFGKGAHGGMPQNGIDPIVMAASAVLRLQTIVSREISPQAQVVVTVGEFHGGTAENIIPAEAYIKLNVRTTDEAVRDHVLAAIRRICVAEARASNAPKDPEFEEINNYPLTVNDAEVTRKVADAFRGQFGDQLFEAPSRVPAKTSVVSVRHGSLRICTGLSEAATPKSTTRRYGKGGWNGCPVPIHHSGRPYCIPHCRPVLKLC